MANKNDSDTRMDDLLKQVLSDDLPSDVEGRLKAQFVQFERNIEESDRKSKKSAKRIWQRFFHLGYRDWRGWGIRSEVLAFSSLVMIVIGAFLHVSGHRSAMADTLSFLNTSVSITRQVVEATSMECRMQVLAEGKEHLSYIIRWTSPELARADIREGEKAVKTLLISGSDITVTDHIKDTLEKYKSLDQVKDEQFKPVLEFLSPNALATAIYEQWKPEYHREEYDGQKGTFVYVNNGERATLEMTVDLSTNLPLGIRKFSSNLSGARDVYELTMVAQFVWNEPISHLQNNDNNNQGREK